MAISRRTFLTLAGAGAGTLLARQLPATDEPQAIDCAEAYGVLVDTTVCIGCRKCEWACAQENKLSDRPLKEFEDKAVFAQHRRPDHSAFTVVNAFENPAEPGKQYSIKVQCMHCARPACVSACIVGALTKEKLGPVVYDAWKCIGCRYCMVACPFQVPAYEYANALDPRVRKCTFCSSRIIGEHKKPACVSICPNEALTFGTREELLEGARSRILNNPERYNPHIYGENEVGGTAWLYLAPCEFKHMELPKLPDKSLPDTAEKIQHGVFKSFVPPLALYGLLGLIMHSTRRNGEETEDNHEQS